MARDRGSIKWTSLMLPEHVTLLEELWHQDEEVAKPILDEQQQTYINNELMKAYKQREKIQLSVHDKRNRNQYNGYIDQLLPHQNKILLKLDTHEKITISFSSIINIKMI